MTRFRQGMGRLTAEHLNAFLRSDNAVARHAGPAVNFRSRWHGPIVCKVLGATAIGSTGSRWRYDVREVTIENNYTADQATNAFESDRVLNLAEWGNTATVESGVTKSTLPGTFELKRVPDGTLVPVWVGHSEDSTYTHWAWFDRPGEFDGSCEAATSSATGLVQSFTGSWSSSTQYNGTEVVGTKDVVDLSVGAERWAANSIRFWNGSEATNAGASLSGSRYNFSSAADCRTWWDNYTIRCNINSEGWRYLNTGNSDTTTVGGSCQPAYVNTAPAFSWSGSDFSAGLTMDVEVYELGS